MTSKRVDVSVVVVNWNTRDDVLCCIASILSTTHRPFEIIVVDNASTDGSAEALNAIYGKEPRVVVLPQERNVGYSRGNNIGFAAANGEYVFILNPDTIVREGSIDFLVKYLDDHPDVGAVGPWISGVESGKRVVQTPTDDVRVNEWWINRFWRVRVPWIIGRFLPPITDRRAEIEVDWVLNAASMLRRTALPTREGLFDELFFIGTEEIELSMLHLIPAGYRSVILPYAQVVHLVGRSFSHRFELRALLTRYSQTAVFYRRAQIYGSRWARVDAAIGALDYAILGLLLVIRWLFGPRADRLQQAAVYRGLVAVNLHLTMRGETLALVYDQRVRETLSEKS